MYRHAPLREQRGHAQHTGDCDSGDDPDVGAEPALHSFTECAVSSVSVVGPVSEHLSMVINQSIPKAAAATSEEMQLHWRRI